MEKENGRRRVASKVKQGGGKTERPERDGFGGLRMRGSNYCMKKQETMEVKGSEKRVLVVP